MSKLFAQNIKSPTVTTALADVQTFANGKGKPPTPPAVIQSVKGLQGKIPAPQVPSKPSSSLTLPLPVGTLIPRTVFAQAAHQAVAPDAFPVKPVDGSQVQPGVESLMVSAKKTGATVANDSITPKDNSGISKIIQGTRDGFACIGAVSSCASVWPAVFGKFDVTLELFGVAAISFVVAAVVDQVRKILN